MARKVKHQNCPFSLLFIVIFNSGIDVPGPSDKGNWVQQIPCSYPRVQYDSSFPFLSMQM